jgi:hypothetical protein
MRFPGIEGYPPPPLFVNYSESAGSRVFGGKILGIKALSPRRMELVSPCTNFMMGEVAAVYKGRCHRVGVENLRFSLRRLYSSTVPWPMPCAMVRRPVCCLIREWEIKPPALD